MHLAAVFPSFDQSEQQFNLAKAELCLHPPGKLLEHPAPKSGMLIGKEGQRDCHLLRQLISFFPAVELRQKLQGGSGQAVEDLPPAAGYS
jgi:hypothetical protein